MATVEGLTKARMLEIEAACIVGGAVELGNLILERRDGTTFNAGIVQGPQGPQGDPGPVYVPPAWADWVPVYADKGAMTVVEAAHAANHKRYAVIGKTCFVSFSWVLTFGGTLQASFTISLPVQAAKARQVFSGDIVNMVARAITADDTTKILMARSDGAAIPAGSYHVSFNGVYETV